MQELLKDDGFTRSRSRKLRDELLLNHNVYVIVDSMIRANEAVFVHGSAPDDLMEVCGTVAMLFEKNESWHALLTKHRAAFEKALGY